MNRAWVDYNDIEDRITHSIVDFCDNPPVEGENVLTYDGDDNTCEGLVIKVVDTMVTIQLAMETWRDGPVS